MSVDTWSWAVTGAVTAVLAPGLLIASRRWIPWQRVALRPAVSAPGFVVLHALITAALVSRPSLWVWLGLHAVLLGGSLLYWAPVLGRPPRLGGAGRCGYLFLSSPLPRIHRGDRWGSARLRW